MEIMNGLYKTLAHTSMAWDIQWTKHKLKKKEEKLSDTKDTLGYCWKIRLWDDMLQFSFSVH